MFCKNCGKPISNQIKICSNCGVINEFYIEPNESIFVPIKPLKRKIGELIAFTFILLIIAFVTINFWDFKNMKIKSFATENNEDKKTTENQNEVTTEIKQDIPPFEFATAFIRNDIPETKLIKIPDIKNKSYAEAKTLLKNTDYTRDYTYEFNDNVEAGKIIDYETNYDEKKILITMSMGVKREDSVDSIESVILGWDTDDDENGVPHELGVDLIELDASYYMGFTKDDNVIMFNHYNDSQEDIKINSCLAHDMYGKSVSDSGKYKFFICEARDGSWPGIDFDESSVIYDKTVTITIVDKKPIVTDFYKEGNIDDQTRYVLKGDFEVGTYYYCAVYFGDRHHLRTDLCTSQGELKVDISTSNYSDGLPEGSTVKVIAEYECAVLDDGSATATYSETSEPFYIKQ